MRLLVIAALIAATLSSSSPDTISINYNKPDEITIPVSQIISCTVDNITGDDTPVLLMIRKRDACETDGELYDAVYEDGRTTELLPDVEIKAQNQGLVFGNDFLICEYPGYLPDLSDPDGIIRLKKLFCMDFTSIRPMSVRTGDINGDGVKEISICVYKTTAFHPVYAKRPFVYHYDTDENRLDPVWLGSRLSRPFDDYLFADIDGDGIDELVSTETDRNGGKVVTCYYWCDFGFYKLGESPSYDNILSIRPCSQRNDGSGTPVRTPVGIEATVEINGVDETIRFIYIKTENADPSGDYGKLEKA